MKKKLLKIFFGYCLVLVSFSCGKGGHKPIDPNLIGIKNQNKTNPNSVGVTFADVKPIFQKCTTCHGAGKANVTDWLDYNSAVFKKAQLMDRVVIKGDMPLGFKLDGEEIKILATWLKTGTLPEPEQNSVDQPSVPVEDVPVEQPINPPVISPTEPAEPVVTEPMKTPWPANLISIKKIFDETCIMCHTGAMENAPDWQNFSVVESKKDRIYDRVLVKKDMPMAVPMTDEKREIIKNWLDGKPVEIQPWPEQYAEVRDLIAINCNICHNANSGQPNWADYAVVESKLSELRNRLFVTKDMPYSMSIQQSDIDKIKNWLDEVNPKE